MSNLTDVLHRIVNIVDANATHKDEIHQAIDELEGIVATEKNTAKGAENVRQQRN